MRVTPNKLRNQRPAWGFAFLRNFQRLPGWFTRPLLAVGTWVAVARMPAQRQHSREFLTLIYGRPATLLDVWRHFFSFLELLMLRLNRADGGVTPCALDPENAADFEALMHRGEPALFGLFHF